MPLGAGLMSKKDMDRQLMWIGSKGSKREFIAQYVPQEASVVLIPFFGSGVVEFQLLRSRPQIHIHGSDLHIALVAFWRAMLTSSEAVAASISRMVPKDRVVSKEEFAGMVDKIRQESNAVHSKNDVPIAARLWIVNHLCFNGKLGYPSWQQRQAECLRRFREKRIQHVRAFEAPLGARARLKLEMKDWFEAGKSSPPETLLFLDPPYLTDKGIKRQPHLKRKGLSMAEYACGENWGLDKHTELCSALSNRLRWILCHRDHPEIRKLYSGYQMIQYRDGKVWAGSSSGKRVELLVLSPWVSQNLQNTATNEQLGPQC